MGKIKKIFTLITPPFIIILLRGLFLKPIKSFITTEIVRNQYWDGNYENWEIAQKLCQGYDSDIIINKCFESIRLVAEGKAVYERDSVLFDTKEYSVGLIASFFIVGMNEDSRLSVLDFGGSLGTTYFQNKDFFENFKTYTWAIVEQEKFYDLGRKYFENNHLQFTLTIEECVIKNSPNL